MPPAAEVPALEFAEVRLPAGPGRALAGICLAVAPGGAALVQAPAPLGASALFAAAAGLADPAAGRVRVLGEEWARLSWRGRRRLAAQVGAVFANGALISNLDLAGNLALPLRYHTALAEPEIEARVAQLARRLGLTDCLAELPGALAGEQILRCALGRALVLAPRLLLLDDPPAFLRREAAHWAAEAAGRTAVRFAAAGEETEAGWRLVAAGGREEREEPS